MPILPTFEAPFGLFEPLHQHVLATARPLTWGNWWQVFVIPLVPLYIQALLLRYEGTRLWRLPLGGLGIALLWDGGLKYRFTQPCFNALNNGIGIAVLHLTVRYLEFALLEGPVFDRYYAAKGRNLLVSAFDVCINARWIGLGAVDLDHGGKVTPQPQGGHHQPRGNGHAGNGHDAITKEDGEQIPDGGVQSNGHFVPHIKSREAWLPWTDVERTRLQAVARHARLCFTYYAAFDCLLALIRHFGSDTIASLGSSPNSLQRFSHEQTFVLFPRFAMLSLRAPPLVVELTTTLCVATGVWLGIAMGYHLFAFICVGTGSWETESWEVDLFDQPLAADSLLDFWGRRWHQFFRHHFILVSTLLLKTLRLPPKSSYIMLLSFFFSGAMHACGQFLMDPVPSFLPLCGFFVLSGVGCALEVMFKRMTGLKVRGIFGRIWVWAFMLVTGRLAVIAWLEAGVGGCYLSPEWAGKYLKDFVVKWVVDTV